MNDFNKQIAFDKNLLYNKEILKLNFEKGNWKSKGIKLGSIKTNIMLRRSSYYDFKNIYFNLKINVGFTKMSEPLQITINRRL